MGSGMASLSASAHMGASFFVAPSYIYPPTALCWHLPTPATISTHHATQGTSRAYSIMRASLFSKLRPSLRSLATPAAFHRLIQHTPPSHVGRALARLSCCALHPNTTRLKPRACGLLGGHQRRPSLARRLLSSHSPRDPYTVLDVPRVANQAAIRQGYFRAAKMNHPDVDKSPGADVRFREISEAYDLLRDPGRRSAFDARGFDPGSSGGSSGFGGFGGGPRPGERSSRSRQWEDEMFGAPAPTSAAPTSVTLPSLFPCRRTPARLCLACHHNLLPSLSHAAAHPLNRGSPPDFRTRRLLHVGSAGQQVL